VNFDPSDDLSPIVEDMRVHTLQVIKAAVTHRLGAGVVDQLRLDVVRDMVQAKMSGDLVYALTAYLLTDHVGVYDRTIRESRTVHVPATWWQHWKQAHTTSWWAGWIATRWPPRLREHALEVTVEVHADFRKAFPEASIRYPEHLGRAVNIAMPRYDVRRREW